MTDCDREPIHVPGAIQPRGLLLIAERDGLRVVGGAGELEARLSPDWLGASLPDLLGAQATARLQAASAGAETMLGRVDAAGQAWDATAHAADGLWLVELEPAPDGAAAGAAAVLAWLDEAGFAFERTADLQALCRTGAGVFRQITGFDHVMIYRFLDDGSGVVLAEELAPEGRAFLNHHFPASDIPQQARALYVRNRVRVIADAGYAPAPLRPAEMAGVDLSDVALRSVSPIHVEYLRNMGVAASASISIVKDGLLWGLVACHNHTPRSIPLADRLTCRTLAGGFARQVRAKEEAQEYRERLRIRTSEDRVAVRLLAGADAAKLVEEEGEELVRMLGADGFAMLADGALHLAGRCPDRDDVRLVADWVRAAASAQPVHTDRLGERFAPAADFRDLASGLLAFTVPTEVPTVMMWFRAEALQVVKWAGDPHKAVKVAPGERLTPRTSFEAWSQEVRGRARPWTPVEVEAANRFQRTVYEARQTQRIHDLNRDLTAASAEKDALLAQKDYLLKEVNHRVQNSLQLVSAFLSMQARAENDPALTRSLSEAQRRLSAVALVHRRLYSDRTVETVDLARYLEELVTDMRATMGAEWADRLTLDLAPILIPADSAVNVGLILTELVINAQKYAYGGEPGPIAISLEQHRNRFRLIVADQGRGRQGARQGFGTRMLTAMVERLGGSLEEADNKPGLRVFVTAPIQKP
ncbi:MAG: GAF domain-containing protein [Caulobacteraceae bacterium]|nr:GAF domain-containing protein [Caulobacter sp.]